LFHWPIIIEPVPAPPRLQVWLPHLIYGWLVYIDEFTKC
jgi:hypothetical protein